MRKGNQCDTQKVAEWWVDQGASQTTARQIAEACIKARMNCIDPHKGHSRADFLAGEAAKGNNEYEEKRIWGREAYLARVRKKHKLRIKNKKKEN